MYQRRSSIGIEAFLLYFMILVLVWGYAIGWYIEEVGVSTVVEARSNYEERYRLDVFSEESESVSGPSESLVDWGGWDSVALLKTGQFFQYNVLTRKAIDVSYDIIKETGRFFVVDSTARIKTSATGKTHSSIIKLDVRNILIKEKFSVDKVTGGFSTLKYTNSFWNMEACLPTRHYFLNGNLEEGSSWEVPGTGVTVEVVGGEDLSGFYTYMSRIKEEDNVRYTIWVSREVPLLMRFSGENCLGGSETSSRLVRYMPEEGGKIFEIEAS